MEKKVYEEPSVKKVEFDFNECIAASGFGGASGGAENDGCDGDNPEVCVF